jgi:hypothetical protein
LNRYYFAKTVIISRRCCIDEDEEEKETKGARTYVISFWIKDIRK